MSTYGKRCVRCQTYFVTEHSDDRLCVWCSRILSGSGQSPLITSEAFV